MQENQEEKSHSSLDYMVIINPWKADKPGLQEKHFLLKNLVQQLIYL